MADTKNSDFSTDLTLVPRPYDQLSFTQQSYVDWKALGGFVSDTDASTPRKMPLSELAVRCNVTIDAFAQAKAAMPNFWDLVAERRKVLGSQTRLQKVHDVMYISALMPGSKGYRDRVLYLANFDPAFRMPTEQVKHDLGDGLADALNLARERQAKQRVVVEAEIVDVTPDA